jgi:hypothetical protein
MKRFLLLFSLVQVFTFCVRAQTIEQQLSYRLSPFYTSADQSAPEATVTGENRPNVMAPTPKHPEHYPPRLYVKTAFSGAMLYIGGGLLGGTVAGLIGKQFIDTTDDWAGFDLIPYVVLGGVAGATALSTVGIHYSAKRFCNSSYWYAAGGIVLTLGLGAVLTASTGEGNFASAAVILAPLSGTLAYFHFGKPVDPLKNNTIQNE